MMKTNLLLALTFFTCVKLNAQSIFITEVIVETPTWLSESSSEWFEIYNNTNDTVDIQGWSFRDEKNNLVFFNSPLEILPFSFKVVKTNSYYANNQPFVKDKQKGNKPTKFIIDSHDTFFFKEVEFDKYALTNVKAKGVLKFQKYGSK